jgi:hypothetical protein
VPGRPIRVVFFTKRGDSPRAVGEGNAVGLPSSTADSVAESNVLREPAPTLYLLLESRRDPPVVALRLPPANGFDPSGIRCPGRPIRVVFFTKLGDSPRRGGGGKCCGVAVVDGGFGC